MRWRWCAQRPRQARVIETTGVSPTRGLKDLPLTTVRSSRQAQRLELARVTHWRRLLKARIDLIVAFAVLPDPLGGHEALVPPSGAGSNLPNHALLVDAVRRRGPSELDRLGELLDLDRRLASYEAAVTQALCGTTEEFIRRLAMDPSSSLLHLHDISCSAT